MKTKNEKPNLYQVELPICTGMSAPIPVLPPLPHYRSVIIGEPQSKRGAMALMRSFCKLNPGYRFSVVVAKPEAK